MSKKTVLYKSLAIAVIVLFIVIGIQPAIANKPTPINEEIYENTNCFVIGKTSFSIKSLTGIFNKPIGFGIWDIWDGGRTPSEGWIFTIGEQGRWLYQGEFWGKLGVIRGIPPDIIASYKGIAGFHGVCLGGIIYLIPFYNYFIGYAKEVKITTKEPSMI